MKVCIVGLGYVGLTLAVYLARKGLNVHGVDINPKVLESLKQCKAHFYEKDFDTELKLSISEKKFTYSDNYDWTKECSENILYIITVGTTLGKDGLVNLNPIKSVSSKISTVLKDGDAIALRSTVKIGVTRKTVKPILDSAEVSYHLAFCPERTLEGCAFEELSNLPQIVSGIDEPSLEFISNFFKSINTEVIQLDSVEAAEMVKLLNNSERDLMFALGNEIGMMCDAIGIDAYKVIDASNYKYPRSNIKKPGPVGGPCLEKDPYILTEGFADTDYQPSIFLAGRKINESVIENTVDRIISKLGKQKFNRIAVLGFAFKGLPPTGDVRGSLVKDLLTDLHNKKLSDNPILGHDYLADYDDMKSLNVDVIENLEESLKGVDLIILQNNHPSYRKENWLKLSEIVDENCVIIDYWNQLDDLVKNTQFNYYSLGNM